jgi:hypothetical protein
MKALRKAVSVGAGFFLLLAGAILAIPGVPGPGIPVMILGLVILAEHYHWARRMLAWVKRKAEQVRERVQRK